MTIRIKAPWLVGLVVAPIAFVGTTGHAMPSEATELKGITVTAQRMMTVEHPAGVIDKELQVKTLVSYADLDVSTASGRKKLEARIAEAASAVCTEIDKVLPARTLEHGNCVREATERAMAQVK